MPAEAFIRLIYGRLDTEHTPATVSGDLAVLSQLRSIYPGFLNRIRPTDLASRTGVSAFRSPARRSTRGLHSGAPGRPSARAQLPMSNLARPRSSLNLEYGLNHLRAAVQSTHSEGATAGIQRQLAGSGGGLILETKVGLTFG